MSSIEGPRQEEARKLARDLRGLLNEWDPIGARGDDWPDDEYDCLLWPLLRLLQKGVPRELLVAHLTQELRDHFGLDAATCEPEAFAARAQEWYRAHTGSPT